MLDKAATFYAAFTREESSNVKLRTEAAWAHSRLGDVNRLLDRHEDAIREYVRAIASFEVLAGQYPRKVEYRRALAYCHNWLGETLRSWLDESGGPDSGKKARAEYDAAITLQAPIHEDAPANPLYAQELASTYYNRGILSYVAGDLAAASSDFGAAIHLLQPIRGATTALDGARLSPLPAEELARAYSDLATVLTHENGREQARSYYEQAIQIAERLSAADPQSREYKYELAQYCDNLARLLVEMHELKQAADRNHQASTLSRTWSAHRPRCRWSS